jgi:DMSO/TMAO reductase YedYZ molybdopterin-dependent catalytic subunit
MRVGVLAALTQLAVGEATAAALPGARSPLTGLGQTVIDLTPGVVVDITVALVEDRDKPLLRVNLAVAAATIGAAAGHLCRTRPRAAQALLAAHHVVAGAAAARRIDARAVPSMGAAGAGIAAGIATMRTLDRRPAIGTEILAVVVVGAATASARRSDQRRRAAHRHAREVVAVPVPTVRLPDVGSDQQFTIGGLSPLLTPTASFYETDVTFPVPQLDATTWRLGIEGLVDRPFTLSFDGLLDAGVEEFDATLVCVHNPVGGPRIGTARWLGVPVSRLLDRAGVRTDADQLLAHAVDGFTAGVPLATLHDHRAFVVVGMNGELLPPGHGYPARLLVPGLYGYDANTKWVTKLELTRSSDVADYWTRRGWPAEPARVRPSARIDTPGPRTSVLPGRTTVAGVAWAPPIGVHAVDLSIDDGPWQATVLTRALHPDAWRQWRIDVDLAPGAHTLVARPRTSDDDASPPAAPPYPNGTAGLHRITIDAAETPGSQGRALREVVAVSRERLLLARDGERAWRSGGPRHTQRERP